MNNNIVSVSIDLGTKNTGLYISDLGTKYNSSVIEFDSTQLQTLMKPRREKRHAVRNNKRKKLAQRLLLSLLMEQEPLLKEQEIERLRHYVKRRGHNYIQTEELIELKENHSMELLSDVLSRLSTKYDHEKDTIEEHFNNFIEENYLNELQAKADSYINNKDKDKKLKEDFKTLLKEHDIDVKNLKAIIKSFKNIANELFKGIKENNFKREKYLDNIKEDLQNGTVES